MPAATLTQSSMETLAGIFPTWTAASATVSTSDPPTPTETLPKDPKEVLGQWSSLIGIVTAIVGNVLIALALNVQRYAHTRLHKERVRVRQRARAVMKRAQSTNSRGSYGTMPGHSNGHDGEDARRNRSRSGSPSFESRNAPESQESDPLAESYESNSSAEPDPLSTGRENTTSNYLKSPYWWLGQILITLGEMGNFLAYGFAPASIVSPLGVVALISNCIIAPVMFHERFRTRDFWGVVIAVAGVVTVVMSASQEETKLEPHDVWDAITTMEFEIYLAVTLTLIVILMWASRKFGRRTLLIDLGLVGLFGGYTALATKGVSSMLSSTLWRAFTTPVTYALIFILLVTAIMQIRYVNKALQRFDSTQVIPIQFVLFTLSVILGSAILYRDFKKTTPKQSAFFVGGCLLTFFGVFLITSGRQHKDEEDEDRLSDVDGVEETIGLTRHEEASESPPTQDLEAPKSRSRRSSRLSKVSFADASKPVGPQDRPAVPTIQQRASESAPHLLAIDPESVPPVNMRRDVLHGSASIPRGVRTVSADSAGTLSSALSMPEHPHTTTSMRDVAVAPIYSSDRPVTPRHSFGVSRASSRHQSNPFISPSPLSSTVTTFVKDAFLRENDSASTHRSSLRRIRSSIRASLFFSHDHDENVGPPDYVPLPGSEAGPPGPGDDAPSETGEQNAGGVQRTRSRGMSDFVRGFFRPKKKQKPLDSSSDVESIGSRHGEHRYDDVGPLA